MEGGARAPPEPMTRKSPLAALALASFVLAGCSINRLAVNKLGDALAGGTSTYATDDDPELVGQALPFALKTIEGLLQSAPEHRGLLLAAASGFTQYSYAFVHSEADYVESGDLARATVLRRRAVRLYQRARGLRPAAVSRWPHRGFGAALRRDSAAVAMLGAGRGGGGPYWTGARVGGRRSRSPRRRS